MARTSIVVRKVARGAGLLILPDGTITAADAVNDHYMENDGETVLMIRNTSASVARTATIKVQKTLAGLDTDDITIGIDPEEIKVVGPFPQDIYGAPDSDDNPGSVHVDIGNNDFEFQAWSWRD